MNLLKGAIVALVSSYFISLLYAFTFRFPIPFAGLIGPQGTFGTANMSVLSVCAFVLVAWAVYGLLGGFLVVAAMGAGAGYLVGRLSPAKDARNLRIILSCTLVTFIPITFLSTLDFLIGPW
ncbi:MAG: hypothetical protein JST24_02930 [Acidobacteria bacterium]|nr:hypothetical protein [Acidobacteriota bacterium]